MAAEAGGSEGMTTGWSPDKQEQFTFFWGNQDPFSNFYRSPFKIDGIEFNCAEQYFHYMKAVHFGDKESGARILEAGNPGKQKRLGRLVENFDKSQWDIAGLKYMKEACIAKFSQNGKLLSVLLSTKGTTLVEASPVDKIWGIGLAKENPCCTDRKKWAGQNLLGIILTQVRDEFLQQDEPTHTGDRKLQES